MSGADYRLNRRQVVKAGAGAAAGLTLGGVPFIRRSSLVEAADVPRNQTLILVGVGGEAPNQFTDVQLMNPYLPGIARGGYQIMFEPCAFYNMIGGEETKWLAEDYKYNADFTEVDVTFRKGITWSDGTPFTANDAAFTINMLRDNAPTLAWSTDMKQWVKDAQAVDDLNLKITLNAPNPRFFFSYLTNHADIGIFFMPEHIWKGQDPTKFTNFDMAKGWPVVLGPYKLVQSTPQQKVWDLRDDWWAAKSGFQPAPAVKRLIFLPGFDESKMAEMVVSDQADITLNLSPATMPTLWAQNPKVTTFSGHNPPYGNMDWWPSGLGFNDTTAPWSDPEIRWALSYAIDRQKLVEFGYRGAGVPAQLPYPAYPPLQKYMKGIDDLLKQYPTNEYNLKKTEEILTKKGYSKSGGKWTKDGKKLSLAITTFSVFGDIAPILTQELQNAGIDASFAMPADFISRIFTGQADSFIFGHGGSVRDPYFTLRLYQSKYSKPNGQQADQPYRWKNDAYDKLVDQMGSISPDDPKTEQMFHDAMAIWLPQLPDIPLLQFYHRIPIDTKYWTGWPTTEDPYMNPAFWHRTFLLVLLKLRPSGA